MKIILKDNQILIFIFIPILWLFKKKNKKTVEINFIVL